MSEHLFGVGHGQVEAAIRARIDAVVKPLGVTFTNPHLHGEGYRYWFAGPNRGEPFDWQLHEATYKALERAGLLEASGELRLREGR